MSVFDEVQAERERQDARFGEQNHPDGEPDGWDEAALKAARNHYELCAKSESLTWRHILEEEVAEVFAARTEEERRQELLQVAAVAIAQVQCIDRRRGSK